METKGHKAKLGPPKAVREDIERKGRSSFVLSPCISEVTREAYCAIQEGLWWDPGRCGTACPCRSPIDADLPKSNKSIPMQSRIPGVNSSLFSSVGVHFFCRWSTGAAAVKGSLSPWAHNKLLLRLSERIALAQDPK